MTPTENNTQIYYAIDHCYLGLLMLVRSERGVCLISLADTYPALLSELSERFPKAISLSDDAYCLELLHQLKQHLDKPNIEINFNMDINGTAFQQQVWQALRQIPTGQTRSYTEIAKHINAPRAVRAVANACAANPLAIIIPCHRAIRTDGQLSGYRWGIARKNALLQKESSH